MKLKSVMLVDDDSVCNFINKALFNKLGISDSIDVATNGSEALELLNHYMDRSRHIPDIILLDINMPIMNGFQFLEAFNKLSFPMKRKISIVILTSSEDPNDIVRAKEFGIDHYLSKPLDMDKLKEVLELG